MIIGVFSAASSAGQLIFLPSLMGLTPAFGWRSATLLLLGATAVLLIPVALCMRDRPESVGLRPLGDDGATVESPAQQIEDTRRTSRRDAVRIRDYHCCWRAVSSSAATPRTGWSARI